MNYWGIDVFSRPYLSDFLLLPLQPGGSAGKESASGVEDLCSIPWLEGSTGEEKGYPLQYSGLENSKNHRVYGVTKSRIWLSDFHFLPFQCLSGWCRSSKLPPKNRQRPPFSAVRSSDPFQFWRSMTTRDSSWFLGSDKASRYFF